jgi:glutamine cyclotransferase
MLLILKKKNTDCIIKIIMYLMLIYLGSCKTNENYNSENEKIRIRIDKKDMVLIKINMIDFQAKKQVRVFVNLYELKVIDSNWINITEYSQLGENTITVVETNKNGILDTTFVRYFYKLNIEFSVVQEYLHNEHNFTQGLFIDKDTLYESTGLIGESKILKQLISEKKLLGIDSTFITKDLFGEGITCLGSKIYQLTWKDNVVLCYTKNKLKYLNSIRYPREGWGLCTYKDFIIASDGTNKLYILNELFKEVKVIEVKDENGIVNNINELECFNDILFANIWQTNKIVLISLKTGFVIGELNLNRICKEASRNSSNPDVLNGIAYDKSDTTFFVTGKKWSRIYRIKIPKNELENISEKNK